MEQKLHLLDSFSAQGSDGTVYKVCAYEQLVRDDTLPSDGREHWEPNGRSEYRLDTGEAVGVRPDGSLYVVRSQVELRPR